MTESFEPNRYHPFPGFEYRHENDLDILAWSNRHLPRNTRLFLAFIAGLVITAPLALFLTFRLINDLYLLRNNIPVSTGQLAVSILFVVACWSGIAGISYYLVRLTWTESIKVSAEDVSIGYLGLLAPKGKKISGRNIWRLSFEKYSHGHHQESRFTLNILSDGSRDTVAFWMRDEENYQLYLLLDQIFKNRNWIVLSESDYPGRS